MRDLGIAAIEYEKLAAAERRERLALLSSNPQGLKRAGPAKSQSAAGLAEDYTNLVNEILAVFTEPRVQIVDTASRPLRDGEEVQPVREWA